MSERANFVVSLERGGWELEVLGRHEEGERPRWGVPGVGEQLEIEQIVLVVGEDVRADITDLIEECGGMEKVFEDTLDALRDQEDSPEEPMTEEEEELSAEEWEEEGDEDEKE